MEGAIQRVNGTTDGWDPKFDAPPRGDRPERSPRGPWASVQFPQEDVSLLARWLTAVADDLATQGWTGHLEHIPEDRYPRLPTPIAAPGRVTMTIDLGLSGWDRHALAAPVWRADPSSVSGLVDLARHWLGAMSEPAWIRNDCWCDGTLDEVLRDLRATFYDPQSPASAKVHAGTERHFRSADFSMTGRLGLVDHTEGAVPERLRGHRSLIEEWAEHLDRASVAGGNGPVYPNFHVEWGRRVPLPVNSFRPKSRSLDRRRVPDVCVLQLLTQEHIDATHDLTGWRIDEVAPGKFIVEHPDPHAWFLPAPEGEPGTRVDPEVLARARTDFGAALISPEDVTR